MVRFTSDILPSTLHHHHHHHQHSSFLPPPVPSTPLLAATAATTIPYGVPSQTPLYSTPPPPLPLQANYASYHPSYGYYHQHLQDALISSSSHQAMVQLYATGDSTISSTSSNSPNSSSSSSGKTQTNGSSRHFVATAANNGGSSCNPSIIQTPYAYATTSPTTATSFTTTITTTTTTTTTTINSATTSTSYKNKVLLQLDKHLAYCFFFRCIFCFKSSVFCYPNL
ncbi:uncharacterized protein LOC131676808 [Topomyia yanbarensis]|uniref:uncharacterized protein LOC131676808 n=1 Tax=Topomyia yanbarensis TaxID=2498891 RepID=UPI00273B22B1|nr:uncharacterized protein LOC131676808 [Topomyia yanbarensis]XP_058812109.1 uncharacterized protein LOC131676808 [Topomyia yanbarensis]XP_058812110.1 uncharacterized protein LOC131676808 [Topomyia yanbarensis]XP_058812111.1 uncharacterized protein LOC131676808 [Topomyia yanbarensis]XP_058812112.1 uncharacterized protein LOC131676808 [Topomyia yanbarensis]XP_058812113.1 uncharacterized protein LOC131676808 [Topomyia yanbarensis]XP_058812114.1 uncharacterized protein LOC131676808 [Topomyia yan